MKIYVSKRNPEVRATLDEATITEATVILDYISGDKAGKNVCITKSTLKRWWTLEQETTDEEEIPFPSDPIDPVDVGMTDEEAGLVPELTDDELAQVGLEIAAQAKAKAEAAKKAKKSKKSAKVDRTADIEKVKEVVNSLENLSAKYYESVKCYKLMQEKKAVAEVYPQAKKISCYFKSLDGLNLEGTMMSKDGYKYYLPARVDISYDSDYVVILRNLLK